MSFFRAEALGTLRQYRSFIIAGLFAVFGFFLLFDQPGLGKIAGGLVLFMAILVAHDGYKRMRFPAGSGGPGMVEVDERRVSYLSGTGGGAVSLDALDRVELHRNGRGRITWVFFAEDGMLEVPGDAMGTDKLFDALVALPGVNYAQAEAATQGKGPDLFLIWQKNRTKLH